MRRCICPRIFEAIYETQCPVHGLSKEQTPAPECSDADFDEVVQRAFKRVTEKHGVMLKRLEVETAPKCEHKTPITKTCPACQGSPVKDEPAPECPTCGKDLTFLGDMAWRHECQIEPAAESAARERAVKNYVYPNFMDVEAINAFRAGWDIRDAEIGKLKAELKEAVYIGTQNHDAALALTTRVAELERELINAKAERGLAQLSANGWMTDAEELRAELEQARAEVEGFKADRAKYYDQLAAMTERAEKAEASLSQRTVENLKQIKQRLLTSKKPADFVVIDALLNELDTIEERDALKAELAQAREERDTLLRVQREACAAESRALAAVEYAKYALDAETCYEIDLIVAGKS